MNTNLKHHEVCAEWVDDEYGPAIMLTQQDGWDGPQTTIVHPWQLRSICEHFNLVPAASLPSQRQLETMARRIKGLRDRINTLGAYMANRGDHDRADVRFELFAVNALADLAAEWCEDLDMVPTSVATETQASSRGSVLL